jgi:hypothetical protein
MKFRTMHILTVCAMKLKPSNTLIVMQSCGVDQKIIMKYMIIHMCGQKIGSATFMLKTIMFNGGKKILFQKVKSPFVKYI